MIVREAVGDILKPKSRNEIEDEINQLTDNELVNLIISSKGSIFQYALERDLSDELNGKLLSWAVEKDNLPAVKQILKRNLSPSSISIALSKTFIEGGRGVKVKNIDSDTNSSIFKLLFNDRRLDPAANRNQLIRWAASNGHYKLVKELLNDPRVDPSDINNAALTGAQVYEHDDIIRLLMKDKRVRNKIKTMDAMNEQHGGLGNILKPKSKDEIRQAALQISDPNQLLKTAIEKIGDHELVKIAIERGADPNRVASDSSIKNPEIIKILITDPQTRISPNSLIYKALKFGLEDEVIKLVKSNKLDPGQKNSLTLIWAVGFGRVKLVKILLKDERVHPESEEESIAEALSIAIARGNNLLVKMLLNDERINPAGDYNRPIKIACQFGNKEAFEMLLKDKRVDPSQEDLSTSKPNYALTQAAENGHMDIVAELLKDKRVVQKLSEIELKKYQEMAKKIVRESLVEVEPEVKRARGAGEQPSKPAPTKEPGIKPGKPGTKPAPGHPSPIRRERPSVTPAPKATADDVAKRYIKLVGDKKK